MQVQVQRQLLVLQQQVLALYHCKHLPRLLTLQHLLQHQHQRMLQQHQHTQRQLVLYTLQQLRRRREGQSGLLCHVPLRHPPTSTSNSSSSSSSSSSIPLLHLPTPTSNSSSSKYVQGVGTPQVVVHLQWVQHLPSQQGHLACNGPESGMPWSEVMATTQLPPSFQAAPLGGLLVCQPARPRKGVRAAKEDGTQEWQPVSLLRRLLALLPQQRLR